MMVARSKKDYTLQVIMRKKRNKKQIEDLI